MHSGLEALDARAVPRVSRAPATALSWTLSRRDRRADLALQPRPAGARMARGDIAARAALIAAGVLLAAAIFLPLWHVTISAAPSGRPLRLLVYPTHLAGDVARLNVVNHGLGMRELSEAALVELRLLPVLLGFAAFAAIAGAFVRRTLATALPLALLAATGAYGLGSLWLRLHQLGPGAPGARAALNAFVPPIVGSARVAAFTSRAAFAWGSTVLLLAAALMALALCLDRRTIARAADIPTGVSPTARR